MPQKKKTKARAKTTYFKLFMISPMSAIRFFFLKYDPLRNFVFNPKESLAFDGETGPYIEYSNARINSIFRKLDTDIDVGKADPSLLN